MLVYLQRVAHTHIIHIVAMYKLILHIQLGSPLFFLSLFHSISFGVSPYTIWFNKWGYYMIQWWNLNPVARQYLFCSFSVNSPNIAWTGSRTFQHFPKTSNTSEDLSLTINDLITDENAQKTQSYFIQMAISRESLSWQFYSIPEKDFTCRNRRWFFWWQQFTG